MRHPTRISLTRWSPTNEEPGRPDEAGAADAVEDAGNAGQARKYRGGRRRRRRPRRGNPERQGRPATGEDRSKGGRPVRPRDAGRPDRRRPPRRQEQDRGDDTGGDAKGHRRPATAARDLTTILMVGRCRPLSFGACGWTVFYPLRPAR